MNYHWLLSSLLLIIAINYETNGETLRCEYFEKRWDVIGIVYTCKVQNLHIFANEFIVITEATQNVTSSLSNDDVKAVNMYNGNINESFFPSGIESVFQNLERIQFNKMNLIEIHQADLKPFSELRVLQLSNNKLEVIEENLFEFNTKLEKIWIEGNQISYIHPRVFDHLSLLSNIDLSGNKCEEKLRFSIKRDKVIEDVRKINEKKCFNEKTLEGRDMRKKSREATRRILQSMLHEQNEAVKKEKLKNEQTLLKIEQELNDNKEKISEIQNELIKKIEHLEKSIENIEKSMGNIENFRENIEEFQAEIKESIGNLSNTNENQSQLIQNIQNIPRKH